MRDREGRGRKGKEGRRKKGMGIGQRGDGRKGREMDSCGRLGLSSCQL